jgi:hypothetical protein
MCTPEIIFIYYFYYDLPYCFVLELDLIVSDVLNYICSINITICGRHTRMNLKQICNTIITPSFLFLL